MQLIIYPFIVCVGIFLIQLFFIIRKNKIVYNECILLYNVENIENKISNICSDSGESYCMLRRL